MFPKLNAIKERRKKLSLTQQELAKICEVSQSLIAKIENSDLDPAYTSAVKIFTALESLENKKELKCSDVMKKPVMTIGQNETLQNASTLMKKYQVSQIPVLDGGTVSESTILNKIAEGMPHDKLMKLKIKDIMDPPLPTAPPSSPLGSILPILKISGAVLIVDNKGIIGIITKSDLI